MTRRSNAAAVLPPPPTPSTALTDRVAAVVQAASANAAEVDARGRFPEEAIAAARSERLLGMMVPESLGGEAAGVSATAEVCYRLGRACASTAMIFAMHQIKAACLIRHRGDNLWQHGFLRRVADEQLLLASSTTEGQGGGDVRSSSAAIETVNGRIRLERSATVMSYGAQADAVVTTARRHADAPSTDQVLVAFPKASYRLDPTLAWETLGMRGTCSAGFTFRAEGEPAMIVPASYAAIHAQTMTPTAHLLWSSVWAGVSAAALERARLFLRKAAASGATPPAAAHYLQAASSHRKLRALVSTSLKRYEAAAGHPERLSALDFQTEITLLKVDASELALATVMSAMRACGLSGYRNDGDASIGRHLRDILSAPIMINNDRILSNLGVSALLSRTPDTLDA